jgi:hypothetical protein
VQVNPAMSLEEVFNRLALVRREVVSDYVDLFPARLIGHEVAEEGDELGRRVAWCGLAQHLCRFKVEAFSILLERRGGQSPSVVVG